MEFKNGFQSRFDEIDKENGVFYHVKDSKKIYLDDMVLDDSENIKNDISDYVDKKVDELKTNTDLKLFCIEPIVIKINGEEKTYEGNSYVNVMFKDTDVFEIIPTSNNSIYALYSYPGALGTFYDWLEGVNIFDGILFDMNDLTMYEKWNQGHQGEYHVQYAQYVNCIFWSDNAYVNPVAERTNYTLYYSSQMPLCYSTIPENTFKAFYLAYSVTNDPNWSNKKYIDSFAQATWATQVFSYYGARTIGMYDMDSENFNITLPKDCRGLMYSAPSVRYAGVFDAINVTNFGAKSGSWRDAFGCCYSLETLFIKNLNVSINVSWSPIDQRSIEFILSNAINTSNITISLSPYTYYRLTDANKTLASEKNITLALIEGNADEDNRLKKIVTSGDGTKFLSDDGVYKSIDTILENSIGNYFFIVETEQIDGVYHLKNITFDEIIEKFNNGGNMVCHVDGTDYIPLLSVTTNKIIFSGIYNSISVSLVFDTDGTGTLTSTYLSTSYQITSAKTEAVNESKSYTDAAIANLVSSFEASSIILLSSTPESTKKFRITIDDDGILSADEVIE